MRMYGRRERAVCGILAAIFLPGANLSGYLLAADPPMRQYPPMWFAALGAVGGSWIFLRIAFTGRAPRWVEKEVLPPRP